MVTLANLLTRVPVCLLNNAEWPKSPVGMTDLKNQKDFWGIGNFLPLPTSNSGESLTVSSKPCLEMLPHSILQTPLSGHCLGAR